MNQNYIFLGRGSSAPSEMSEGLKQPPLGRSGFRERTWRSYLNPNYYCTALLMLFFLLLNVLDANAQVGNYAFTQSTQTYTPVESPTTVHASGWDDGIANVTIPFTFTFNGVGYTTASVNSNGYLTFGTTTSTGTTYTPISSTTAYAGAVSAFARDLISNSSTIVSGVEGSAPNRVMVIQWNNARRYSGGAIAGDALNFQIRLYEGTNVAEIRFGSVTITSATVLTSQVGLRGATNAAYVNRSSSTSWSSTIAGTTNAATVSSSSTIIPASGLTFTFTPPAPCTGAPVAGSIAATTQSVCSGTTPAAIAVTGFATGLTGITFQWEQSTDGVAWANVVGGSGATTTTYTPPSFGGSTIMYRMKTLCSGGDSSVTNTATISPPANPATQVSTAVISNYNSSSFTLNWTNGNGGRRMVIVSNAAITDPTNGTGAALTAAAAYTGSGQQIVYDGTGSTVTVTGLTAGGVYNVKVYEYLRCGTSAPYTYYYNVTSGSNAIVHTSCAAITSLPWTEGFEGVTTATTVVGQATGLPNCWNSQATKWSSSSETTYNNARTGTKYIRYAWSSSNAFVWTPGFYLEAGKSYDFSFYAQGDGYTSWNNAVFVNTSVSATGATQLTPVYTPTGPGSQVVQSYVYVKRTFEPTISGTYYFAIRGNESTGSPWYMAFDDFELKETPVVAPPCATTPSIANAATNVARNPVLTWTGSVDTTSYDVYFGTSATPALIGNQTATSYTPAVLLANTQYYWKVVAKNIYGDAIDCTTWSFTTGSAINYCKPVTTSGCTDGDVIARVQLNTLDNNSGTGCPSGALGYSDYTTNPSLTTTLQAGSSYQCTVWAGQYTEGYAAWIDYNDDGVFDASERIGYSNGRVTGSGTAGVLGSSASFPIALACNPAVGEHRLRVRAMFSTDGINVTPCGNNTYGEVEDYIITITEAAACPQPSALAATGVTATTANLSWVLGCAESAWEVIVQPATSSAPTAGSTGVAASALTYAAQELSPGINYHFYVRANCGGDGVSLWTGPFAFTTPPNAAPDCATPVSPANGATGLVLGAEASYNFSWTPATTGQAASSYDVYFGSSAATLSLLGNTANTSVNITGILAGETSYWKIVPRNSVGAAPLESCTVFSFTTAVSPGDNCATAIDLDAQTSPYAGSTTSFTNHINLSCGSSSATAPDGYYKITVPSNYTLTIGVAGTWDSVHAVGYGTCSALTSIVACSDLDTQTHTWANYTGSAQTVYWIQDGYNTESGAFTLTWSLTPPPACTPPTALVTNVTGTSANISWTASDSDPDNGYEYELRTSGAAGSGNTGRTAGGTVTGTSVPTISGLVRGTTYTLYVRSLCAESILSTWNSKAFMVTAPNDTCAQATTITCGQTIADSTIGATSEAMTVCGITGVTTQNTPGVWYKFVGDGSDVTFSTCSATAGDTRMAIYTGSCGTMTCVAGNDDNSACTANTVSSEVLMSTTNGVEYYILIYAYASGTSQSATTVSYNLKVTCVVPCTPATGNDNCVTATALTLGTALASNNTCSTPSSGIAYPSCGNQFATYYDTWYSFNSGSNTTLEVNVAGASSTATGFIVYSGTCGALSPLTGSCVAAATATNITVAANTQYFVRVFTNGSAGRGAYTISVKPPCLRPTGVASSNVTVYTATISWTASTSSPSNGYEYEVRSSGAAGSGNTGLVATGAVAGTTANLTDLLEDTTHSIYVRSVCGTGNYGPWTTAVTFTTLTSCYRPTTPSITNRTSTGATLNWNVPTEALPEAGYSWEVRSSGAAGSGATGLAASGNTTGLTATTNVLAPATTYTLYVRSRCGGASNSGWTTGTAFTTLLANDLCSGAITITCGAAGVTGTTTGATNENMPVCGISGVTVQNTPGVWYKYVSDGTDVTFSTCAVGTGDTRLAVYKGSCGTMTCVGGNDDNSACTQNTSSEVTIADTQAGATYYILVYSWSTTVNFTLTATCAPACTPVAGNNECANAQTILFGSTASNNSCASASLGYVFPSCGSSFATYYDTWYKFNTGSTTFANISLTSAGTVAVGYAVYSGTCSGLTQISGACNDTGASTSLTGLTANTVYYLRVYSTVRANRGNYTINLSVPCNAPTGVSVASTQNSATFQWTASTSLPANGYQYEIRTSGAAGSGATGLASSGTSTTLVKQVSGLTPDTNYTLYVRSACGASNFSAWTTGVTFTTGYCMPAPTSGVTGGITNVTFGTVNNTTSAEAGNYGNYTAMSGTAHRSAIANVDVTLGGTGYVKIWVDWNNDFDFADAGEEVYASVSASGVVNATFTPPANTTVGNHRMRIGAGSSASLTACYTGANAEFEDYTLYVDTNGPVHLVDAACNSTVPNFTTLLYSRTVTGAQAYRFRVKYGNATQVLERTTPYFSLSMLTTVAPSYGVTYTVDVAASVGGQWTDYGKVCQVSTAALAMSKLELCQVGGTSLPAFTTPIYATTVAQATSYRFTVTSSQGVQVFDRPTRFFTLNMLASYNYGVDYSVTVAILNGGTWSANGDACTVRVDIPTVTLRDQYCNGTVTKRGAPIYANTVPGATSYHFRVTVGSTQYVVVRSAGYFFLSDLPVTVPFNTTVGVEVKAFTATAESAYGASCPVTLSNVVSRPGATEQTGEGAVSTAKLTGFPNPFSNAFAIDFTTESEEMVDIVVYDMTGKLVDRRSVSVNEIPTLKIGDNFAAGVYNLILTQGETVKTLRVVKSIN